MGNYENLKQSITEVIRTNGNKEITGAVLQSTLLTIISTVGANATFAGIATPSTNPGTPDGPVFYLASESGTYSNFGSIELQDGLSVLMWNGTWSSKQIFGIDDVPTAGSDNLAKSGGVQEELALGAVYDVSAKNPTAGLNNDGKFESLSALLSDVNLNTLIPTSVRKGGMSIKFIQSSDNNYIQARCIADEFTTDVTQWEKVIDEPVNGSKDLITSGGVAKYMETAESPCYSEVLLDGKGRIMESRDNKGNRTINTEVTVTENVSVEKEINIGKALNIGNVQFSTDQAGETLKNSGSEEIEGDFKVGGGVSFCGDFINVNKYAHPAYRYTKIDNNNNIYESVEENGVKTLHTDLNVEGNVHSHNIKKLETFKDIYVKDWLQKTFNYGYIVSDEKYLGALVSSMDFDDNGNCYLGLLANDEQPLEGGEPVISIFNLHNPAVFTTYKVASRGENLGDYGVCGNGLADCVAKLYNDGVTLKCMWYERNREPWKIGIRNFNIATKSFENNAKIISIKLLNGTLVDATSDNCQTIRTSFGLTEYDATAFDQLIMNSSICYDGTYYYNSFSFGYGSHVILKSSDMETWEYLTEIPIPYKSAEIPICYYGGNIYIISRNWIWLKRYNIANNVWDKSLYIGRISPEIRGAICVYNNKVYGIYAGLGEERIINANGFNETLFRARTTIIQCDLDLSNPVSKTWDNDTGGNYYVLGAHGTSMYSAVAVDNRAIMRVDGTHEISLGVGGRADVVFNKVGNYISEIINL